jgi:hypothetical protein
VGFSPCVLPSRLSLKLPACTKLPSVGAQLELKGATGEERRQLSSIPKKEGNRGAVQKRKQRFLTVKL